MAGNILHRPPSSSPPTMIPREGGRRSSSSSCRRWRFNYLEIYHFCWITLLLFLDITTGLRLVEVRIPNHVVRDNTARLECHYDLDGEALYSVKWYKDGLEFYRYVPRDMPPAFIYDQSGLSIDLHNSTDTQVVLANVTLKASGRYRCEVSAEAPSFQTVSDHGDMVVVALPEEGPRITGGRARYQLGEWVDVNCTSGRSRPATQLSWFINGDLANPDYLRTYDNTVTGREGLETTTLGLKFKVKHKHFRKGDMKLKCLATIASVYWRSNEESVVGDRPQKTLMESREPVFAGNTRADRVQANKQSSGHRTGNNAIKLSELLLIAGVVLVAASSVQTRLSSNVGGRFAGSILPIGR